MEKGRKVFLSQDQAQCFDLSGGKKRKQAIQHVQDDPNSSFKICMKV